MNIYMKYTTTVLFGIMLNIIPLTSDARSSANHQTSKNFRELIVQGERPEITACMVASLNYVRNDSKYNSVRWTDEESDRAIMQEVEMNGHLLRSVRFNARFRLRDRGFFAETWQPLSVVCQQQDENSPEVHVNEISR